MLCVRSALGRCVCDQSQTYLFRMSGVYVCVVQVAAACAMHVLFGVLRARVCVCVCVCVSVANS